MKKLTNGVQSQNLSHCQPPKRIGSHLLKKFQIFPVFSFVFEMADKNAVNIGINQVIAGHVNKTQISQAPEISQL
ncbi:MAG: hypothetical protein QGH63_04545 [Rhodospirillales bacterium]|nr:hypothetical protein [Rhodospirillales bacterium]MDP7424254.1 hypothetical protein [Rhodospirillales bacterium]MDP7624397.1 hypothetical protein [Rhodospirillales bacterium]HJO86940.1 hypothetical protein [Rhodospirillales bacterium]